MALTANITTSDGAEHPHAYAEIYPLTLQTITSDMQVHLTLHCWHSQATKEAGASELSGYPSQISLHGEAAGAAIVAGMAPLADIEWTADPVQNAALAEAAIIAAIEDVVVAQRPEFQRVV